jgi:cell division protein FtsB
VPLPRLTPTRVVLFLAALAVGYFVFTAVGDALLSQRLGRDEQRLQYEISDLERQQRELVAIRDYLQTDQYIEGVARRLLGLVRPGETLVVVSSSVTPTPAPVDAEPAAEAPTPAYRHWWENLYGP